MANLLMDWYDIMTARKNKMGVPSLDAPTSFSTPRTPPASLPTPASPAPSALTAPVTRPEEPVTPPSISDRITTGLQNPAKMGMLGMGLSLMAQPGNQTFGQSVGTAGLHGLKFYRGALEDQSRREDIAERREDRRQAQEDRAEWYQERARHNQATEAHQKSILDSQDAARRAAIEEKEANGQPIPDSIADGLKLPRGTTWGQASKIAPLVNKAGASKKEGDGEKKLPTVGMIGAVNREAIAWALPLARKRLAEKGPEGMQELKELLIQVGSNDPLSGTPNDAKLREALSDEDRDRYDAIKREAQKNVGKMVPAEAVQEAVKGYSPGVEYLRKAKTREEAIARAKKMKNDAGWSKESLEAALRKAGWE